MTQNDIQEGAAEHRQREMEMLAKDEAATEAMRGRLRGLLEAHIGKSKASRPSKGQAKGQRGQSLPCGIDRFRDWHAWCSGDAPPSPPLSIRRLVEPITAVAFLSAFWPMLQHVQVLHMLFPHSSLLCCALRAGSHAQNCFVRVSNRP